MTKLQSIYLSSAQSKSGKTELGVGLALAFQEKGYKVAYFKPFGIKKGKEHVDPEIDILAKIFDQDPATVCAIQIDPLYYETIRDQGKETIQKKIHDTYNSLKNASDLVIIEGAQKYNQMISFDLDDGNLAGLFGAAIIAINPFSSDLDIADILSQKEDIERTGGNYSGCIVNQVPKIMVPRFEQEFKPLLEEHGIKTFGIVEKEPKLVAPTFKEIMTTLNAKLLDEDPSDYDLEVLVEGILVGAMSAHSALSYFRKSADKVIITGGDRADIVMSALETDLAGIILTGNLYPDVRVISAAREKGVPVAIVPYDTYTAASKVNQTVAELQINERTLCKELIDRHVDLEAIETIVKG